MKTILTGYPEADSWGRYRIEPGRKLHIEEYAGRVGLEDLKGISSMAAGDVGRSSSYHRLIDFSEAHLDLSSNDVLRYGLLMRQENFRSDGWHVFVVGNLAAFSVVRMLSHWARTSERCRIFSSREEAEKWLAQRVDCLHSGIVRRHVA